jgi:Restriction endonuclease S subunits
MKNKAGWDKIKLKDVGQIVTGNTPKTSVIENYSSKDFCFFKPGDLRGDNISILYKSENYISKLAFKNTRNLPIGSVLVTCIGTIGNVGVTTVESATNQQINAIIPSSKIDSKFLAYVICSLRQYLNHIANAPIVPIINKTQFSDIDIYLPPLPIQRQIVSELDALSDIITKKKQQLEELNKLAQATFYDMFGDPVSNEKGWEVKKLKDITTKINSGNTPKGGSNVYVQDGITFFRSQNVWKNNLVYDDIAFIDIQTHASMSKSSLKHKDILMTKTGRFNTENSSLGRAALFLGEDDTANINGHVYLIRLKKNQVHGFVLHILTCNAFRELIRNVCVGGIDKRQINKNHIEEFPIIYPSIEAQQSFSIIMDSIHIQKTLIDKSLIDVQQLFDYTMDKYFN